MTEAVKQIISRELGRLAPKNSHLQGKLAKRLGINEGQVGYMIKRNKPVTDNIWRKAKLKLKLDIGWNLAETSNLRLLSDALLEAKSDSLTMCVSERAGLGKSVTYRNFARKYRDVVYLECEGWFTRKSYVEKLCAAAGLSVKGSTEKLIESFIDSLMECESPIVIIDQADKLNPGSFDLFMGMYNALENHCGFVLSGVKALEKRLDRGCQHSKVGYDESWSRLGSKIYGVNKLYERKVERMFKDASLEDVALICKANGVDDDYDIRKIHGMANGDLRKVRREVVKIQKMNK